MPYLVFCTFDLKKATSTDYQNAYADLQKIGLHRVVKAGSGNQVVIPTTSAMGEFSGTSAASVRDDIHAKVVAAFRARRFTSEVFTTVGGQDWAWVAGNT